MSTSQLLVPSRILVPGEQASVTDLVRRDEMIRVIRGELMPTPAGGGRLALIDKVIVPGLPRPSAVLEAVKQTILDIRKAREQRDQRQARIIAFVPTYEQEDAVGRTIESLLLQTREPGIDKIVVCINGPGDSNVAYDEAMSYVSAFKGRLEVIRPEGVAGKVNALNYMFMKYCRDSWYDFVLGIDADIVADKDMVLHLDQELIERKQAGGVMARYSFIVPTDMKGKSRHLVFGQRHEFAATGINHQLRQYSSDILGGQATLFRRSVLQEVADITESGIYYGPWSIHSKVEDAELTRQMQNLGHKTATSRNARAWTGLMFSAHTWQKQRRKWQDGHLEDMVRDFHPWLDRRRWFEQFTLGWNLMIRIMFATLLATSVSLDRFVFMPLWLIPMGLAVLQSFLIALKVPNKQLPEIIRSVLFLPGEVYYVRTLSVWLDSVIVMFLNVKRDGWKNQAAAEASKKKSAMSVWLIIALAVLAPSMAFILGSKALPGEVVDGVLNGLWTTLSIMTALSVANMAYKIVRIIRHFRTLAP